MKPADTTQTGSKAEEEALGRELQQDILDMLGFMPASLFKDREGFLKALRKASSASGVRVPAPVQKALLAALSERDETAELCRDRDGNPEPDPELRDYENVPLGEDAHAYFAREVAAHVPEAWINESVTDEKDSELGRVGYEINFNRYFYVYKPPRSLAAIERDLRKLEKEIVGMLREVTA